tara:strand:+ start:68 stop:364 length:297 start_codon:yes stop_codon:yes gene_type:complete
MTLKPYKPAYIEFLLNTNPDDFIGKYYNIQEFFDKSIEYARKNDLNTNYTKQKFSKDIKKVIPEYYKRYNNIRGYQFINANKNHLINILKAYDPNYKF